MDSPQHWQTASEYQNKAASQQRAGFALANGGDFLAVRVGLWIGTNYSQKQEGEALRRCGNIRHSYLDTGSIVVVRGPVSVGALPGFAVFCHLNIHGVI
ncbi:hypothetical protein JEM67_22635 [Serratia sp. PAMC26656]|nr:hypothetical protein [Serratia sp. PAMC26656]